MRDIGNRIRRYRLSRYATPLDPVHRRLRWFWIVLLAWIAWAGLLSDHSFFRLWRLNEEQKRTTRELASTRRDILTLEQERRDPATQRLSTERQLRRAGMARPGEIIYRINESGADSSGR